MADKERKSGLGTLPTGLIRPTTRPESPVANATVEPPTPADDDAQGRAGAEAAAEIVQPKPKKRKPAAEGPTKGRKIGLPDDVHERLWQYSRKRKMTVSAAATDILNRNLPRYRVETEG